MALLDKLKNVLGQNKQEVDTALDKAGEVADSKTGGKYTDKISAAQERAKKLLDQAPEDPKPER